jgi:site-specific DNA-methyltransferase (adenine-specific)
VALAANQLYQGDCIARMQQLDEGSVDLAFADPPFNIGYDYDVYDDRKPYEHYLDWSQQWIKAVWRVLKPAGAFWLAIGDEYAAELKLVAQNDAGFTCRSWVIWYYTFGVNCTRKFTRSHAHLFHFVKDPAQFTFNHKDRAIRVPSARQLVYADNRANPIGRLPDDTWILRPQDVPGGFSADQDTWYFSRVAGTFKERAGFHGCQMPEQLLGRIIRATSNVGDLVLDPFAGSGTTLAVAKKLDRRWIGFELSADYAREIKTRLNAVWVGQLLDGPADPVSSAPRTPALAGGQLPGRAARSKVDVRSDGSAPLRGGAAVDAKDGVIAAYLLTHDGQSSDRMIADPSLNASFIDQCRKLGVPCSPKECNRTLLRLRKAGKLPRLDKRPERLPTLKAMDKFSFASEIALRMMVTNHSDLTFDDVFCDPELAVEFDQLAESYAPGYGAFHYRWAALQLRKRGRDWKRSAQSLSGQLAYEKLPRARPWHEVSFETIDEVPGIYLIHDEKHCPLYLGETCDLRARLSWQNDHLGAKPWSDFGISSVAIRIQGQGTQTSRRGLWLCLLAKHPTRLNLQELTLESELA